MRWLALMAALMISGCGESTEDWATLYRNSPLDQGMRIHFATFNAPDKGGFNRENCGMAAKVMNANIDASARERAVARDPALGFWCEPGRFREKGRVPSEFQSAFPADSDGRMAW